MEPQTVISYNCSCPVLLRQALQFLMHRIVMFWSAWVIWMPLAHIMLRIVSRVLHLVAQSQTYCLYDCCSTNTVVQQWTVRRGKTNIIFDLVTHSCCIGPQAGLLPWLPMYTLLAALWVPMLVCYHGYPSTHCDLLYVSHPRWIQHFNCCNTRSWWTKSPASTSTIQDGKVEQNIPSQEQLLFCSVQQW